MYDVVTIGSAVRDVFLESPYFKVVRDPVHLEKMGFPTGEAQCFALGAKLEVSDVHITTGGGATNAAITFSRQGFKTACIFNLGKDSSSEQILAEMKKEKVTTFPTYADKIKTSYSVVLLSPNGERTILNYRGASGLMKEKDLPLKKIRTRAVYIVPGTIALNTIKKAVSYFKKQGAMIAINPSSHYLDMGKKIHSLLRDTDIVVMNREEAASFTGVPYSEERDIFKKFDKLVPGLAVMTEGSKGVVVSDGRYLYRAGIYKEKKVIDRTGAGDAFGSGFLAGLIKRGVTSLNVKDIKEGIMGEAVRLASANATSVVEHIGAKPGILDKRQLQLFYKQRAKLKITKKLL